MPSPHNHNLFTYHFKSCYHIIYKTKYLNILLKSSVSRPIRVSALSIISSSCLCLLLLHSSSFWLLLLLALRMKEEMKGMENLFLFSFLLRKVIQKPSSLVGLFRPFSSPFSSFLALRLSHCSSSSSSSSEEGIAFLFLTLYTYYTFNLRVFHCWQPATSSSFPPSVIDCKAKELCS